MGDLENVEFHSMIIDNITLGYCKGNIKENHINESNETLLPSIEFFNLIKLAKQNNAIALLNLGQIYETGAMFKDEDGVNTILIPNDFQTAIALFEKSANEGCEEAYFALGMIFHFNSTIENNREKAKNYFKKSIAFDNGLAYRMLGIYEVENRNEFEASKYFIEGAKLNDPICCYNAALELISGRYYEKNPGHALLFAKIACEQMPDDADFKILLERLYKEIIN